MAIDINRVMEKYQEVAENYLNIPRNGSISLEDLAKRVHNNQNLEVGDSMRLVPSYGQAFEGSEGVDFYLNPENQITSVTFACLVGALAYSGRLADVTQVKYRVLEPVFTGGLIFEPEGRVLYPRPYSVVRRSAIDGYEEVFLSLFPVDSQKVGLKISTVEFEDSSFKVVPIPFKVIPRRSGMGDTRGIAKLLEYYREQISRKSLLGRALGF